MHKKIQSIKKSSFESNFNPKKLPFIQRVPQNKEKHYRKPVGENRKFQSNSKSFSVKLSNERNLQKDKIWDSHLFFKFKWMATSDYVEPEWKAEYRAVKNFQNRHKNNSSYGNKDHLHCSKWTFKGYFELLQENILIWVWWRQSNYRWNWQAQHYLAWKCVKAAWESDFNSKDHLFKKHIEKAKAYP